MLDPQKLKIHQALYGYSNGHNLITSSVEVKGENKRTLLILTDMSGATMLPGFEMYLSGFPLPEGDAFAFSKTWYAEEMERPGCVWTHVLFIPRKIFFTYKNIAVFKKYFKRPNRNELESYSNPVEVIIETDDYDIDLQSRITSSVITSLYSTENLSVFLPSEKSSVSDSLILKIWENQWPSLKSVFSFCTGALSNREINKKSFDLQVIPHSAKRTIEREVKKGIFVKVNELNHEQENAERQDYLEKALNDDCDGFGQFLFDIKTDIEGDRRLLLFLFKCYENKKSFKGNSNIVNLISLVSSRFPLSNEVPKFKKALLGSEKDRNDLLGNLSEAELLSSIASANTGNAFDWSELKIIERVSNLWRNNIEMSKKLIDTLVSREPDEFSKVVIGQFVKLIDVDALLNISGNNPKILYAFIQASPELINNQILWHSNKLQQTKRELVNSLFNQNKITATFSRQLLTVLLQSNSQAVLEDLCHRMGGDFAGVLFDCLTDNQIILTEEMAYSLKYILQGQSSRIVEWFNDNPEKRSNVFYLIPKILRPDDLAVRKMKFEFWLEMANDDTRKNKFSLLSFVLALGFLNYYPASYELVKVSFQKVHDAFSHANEIRAYEDNWMILEDRVPFLGWDNWDKCERLRMALIASFVDNHWPIDVFLLTIQSEETLELVLKTCKRVKSGKIIFDLIKNSGSKKVKGKGKR